MTFRRLAEDLAGEAARSDACDRAWTCVHYPIVRVRRTVAAARQGSVIRGLQSPQRPKAEAAREMRGRRSLPKEEAQRCS
jgi:hypothetical protein